MKPMLAYHWKSGICRSIIRLVTLLWLKINTLRHESTTKKMTMEDYNNYLDKGGFGTRLRESINLISLISILSLLLFWFTYGDMNELIQ